MSEFRDGIKLKTTGPSTALLKLLRKWYSNQSLSELRTMMNDMLETHCFKNDIPQIRFPIRKKSTTESENSIIYLKATRLSSTAKPSMR